MSTTPSPLPRLTDQQRARGLARANAQRSARAMMLQQVRTGVLDLAAVFAKVDDQHDDTGRTVAARTRIRHALLAVPGIGAARADRILKQFHIDADRRLSTLSARRREEVVAAVAEAVAGPR